MCLRNGNVILENEIKVHQDVIIENEKIIEISDSCTSNRSKNDIDCTDMYISPGLIDIHCHGGNGYDFMDGTVEAFDGISKYYGQNGITTIVATSMTDDLSLIKRFISTFEGFRHIPENDQGAEIIGLHLEGPYLSNEMSGAQQCDYLRSINENEYSDLIELSDKILRVSVAPELEGAYDFIRYLCSRNIVASFAHSGADSSIFKKTSSCGCKHVTHLYSGMRSVFFKDCFRQCGAVEAALMDDSVSVEIIADGRHLPYDIIEYVHKVKGADLVSLISDAMRVTGTANKSGILGSLENGSEVFIEDGVAKNLTKGCLAGSVTPICHMVKNLYYNTNIPLYDIIKMASLSPAKVMNLNDRGVIKEGYMADITIFDKKLNVVYTIKNGHMIKNDNVLKEI